MELKTSGATVLDGVTGSFPAASLVALMVRCHALHDAIPSPIDLRLKAGHPDVTGPERGREDDVDERAPWQSIM
jgi:hypothetical protein